MLFIFLVGLTQGVVNDGDAFIVEYICTENIHILF